MTGVLAGDVWRPAQAPALILGTTGVVCLLIAWRLHSRLSDPAPGELLPRLTPVTATLLLIGTAAIGCSNLGVRAAALADSALPKLDGRVVVVEGRVASDPSPMERGFSYLLRSVVVLPQAQAVGAAVPGQATNGRLYVRSYGDQPQVDLGDLVRTEVKLAALDPKKPFDARLARRQVVATAGELVPPKVVRSTRNPLLTASNHFRSRMLAAVETSLPPNQGGLVLGLVIGDERKVSDRVREDFRSSGLSHLTAVSGSNLAMVLGALALVLMMFRASRRLSIVLGLAAVVLFTTITRWEPSVLRAAVMATVALGAFLVGRLPSTGHSFALAFLGLLAFDPMMLWSVGFQLSFAATAGIIWLRPPLIARLAHLPRAPAEALAIGVSAQVAVFPLVAWHFGRISVGAVPANLVATGLVAPITILGLCGGVVSLVSPLASWPLMKMAGLLASVLQWIAKTFGRPDSAEISVPHFNAPETLAAYLLVAAAWLVLGRHRRWARWPGVLGALLLVGATLVPALGSSSPAGLRVTYFDVGSGDAALVESPGGVRILFDGGRDPDEIAARLKRRGLGRIDLVVASHMHADHVTGLQLVLRRMQVGLAVHPGVRAPMLFTLTAERPMEAVTGGDSLRLGDLTVEFLGPSPDLRDMAAVSVSDQTGPEGPGLNDASVVMRVNWAGECVLFTGDLEEAGQAELMDRHPDRINCAVMQAPHHGSGRLRPEFVQAVNPQWVPVSVGPNPYGHPSPKALAIYGEVGAQILRTDLLGDLVLEIDSTGVVNRGSSGLLRSFSRLP